MFAKTGSLENGIENGCCNKANKTADFRTRNADFLTPLCSPYYRGKGCGRLGRNEKRFHVASDSE